MLKANRRWIYDGLFALSGAGARPFIAACCCASPDLQLLPASGGIFLPRFGPRPALFDGGASQTFPFHQLLRRPGPQIKARGGETRRSIAAAKGHRASWRTRGAGARLREWGRRGFSTTTTSIT